MTRRVALALAGVLVVACHARAPRRPMAPLPTVPVDSGHLVYQAALEDASGSRRFRLAVALSRPGRFRLEFLGPVGGPRIVIVSDGEVLMASFLPQRVYAQGPATAEQMGVLLGLPLGTEEFLGLLTGSPAGASPGPRELAGGGSVQVDYDTGASGGILQAQIKTTDAEGNVSLYQVEYLEPGPGPWGLQAHEIRLLHAEGSLTLNLKSASREQPPTTAFELLVPQRFEQVSLQELPGLGGLLFQGGEGP